jgi:multicomponent Na+:H+ antiporter subunit D
MAEHPVLPMLVAALAVAVLPRRAAIVTSVLAPVAAALLLARVDRSDSHSIGFYGYELAPLRLDDLAAPFAYAFVAVTALAMLYGARVLGRTERAAALLHAACGLGVVLAGDLLSLFVWWEVKAVAGAVLIAASGRSTGAAAALRYLYVHVAGGTVLLAGIVWHLSGGGSLAFEAFGSGAAGWLVLVAFALSAAVPPLHAWLPDAYPEASVAGTVVLSAFTTKAAVYALARGSAGTDVLVVVGVAMALYGVVYAVLENDVRRLLSYHIVSQVGFMVAAVGIGTEAAINGATAHAVAHLFYKGLLLMGVGAAVHATGRQTLTEMGGLARAMPLVLALYLVGALSISGVPLFSGFVSKELVVDAARGDGLDLVVQLLKLASVGTFLSTALKLPWFGWGGPDRGIAVRPVPRTMVAAMLVAAAANLAIGLHPAPLYDLMPFPVDYSPFTAAKLVEVTQLLGFTALAFWLLLRRLHGEPTITLDTDWLYRVPPRLLAPTVADLRASADRRRSAAAASLRRWAPRPEQLTAGPRSVPSVTPTAALGAILLVASLLTVGWSLL